MEFYVVGSALRKKKPRDTDLLGVLEDVVFRSNFDLEPEEFALLHEMGEDTVDHDMLKWRSECLGAIRVLQFVFPQLVPIDFKYIPRSLLYEPYREVDITAPPSTWGIGFPDLIEHKN